MAGSRQSRNWSLRHKILLPFFIILLLLGAVATLSFVLLMTQALQKTADDRLVAGRDVIFREIKNQEFLLQNYADLIGYAYLIAKQDIATDDLIVQQEQLLAGLSRSEISAEFFADTQWRDIPSPTLRELIDHAVRSGKTRFRFITDHGDSPALTVATLMPRRHREQQQVLVLQTPIKASFLNAHSIGFGVRTTLLALTGEVLSSSDPDYQPPPLSAGELAEVINGQTVIHPGSSPLDNKLLYSSIPLGTSELVLSVIEIPMTDLNTLVNNLTLRGVASLFLFVLLGGVLYYQLLQRQIMLPVGTLLKATQTLSWGNFDFRIGVTNQDELGQVAQSFNLMADKLQTLYEEKIHQEKNLAAAEEELRYQSILAEKNRLIEQTNTELTAHVNELSALFSLIQEMISSLDLDVLFGRVLQVIKDIVACDELILLLYQPASEQLEARKTLGIPPGRLKSTPLGLGEEVTGEVARTREPLHIRQVQTDPRTRRYRDGHAAMGSLLSVPMIVKEQLLGVINLHKRPEGGFSEREIRLVQAITAQAAIAIDNARLYQQTRELSNTDSLTQLANRRQFQTVLEKEFAQARRYRSNFSLIMVDIDHFKLYNDCHGHLQGDGVLREVAHILQENIREIDLAARFGGEEFIILMPKTNKEGARAAAEKLRRCVAGKDFPGAGQSQPEGRLTLSLGIAEFPDDGQELDHLLERADQALYQAKNLGRNRTVAWNSEAPPLPYLDVRPLTTPEA